MTTVPVGASRGDRALPGGANRRHRLVEALLRPEPGLSVPPDTHGASVGEDAPSLHGIGKLDLEDLADLDLEVRIQHRECDLDAAVEVARHPVCGGEQVFRVLTVLEVEDPRVLEIAVDDGDHADPRREPGHRGAQATDAAREQEVVEASRARVAGEEVEQLGEIFAERVATGEEPEIAVDATRPHVVVAGGEVAVAPETVSFLPDDEARLAVGLEARAAVDDVSAYLLERTGPADVRLLVEARLQLDEDGDLLAVLDGRAQRVRDR